MGVLRKMELVRLVWLKKFGNESRINTNFVTKQLPKQLPFFDLVGFLDEILGEFYELLGVLL